MLLLPDVNVWVALVVANHSHHDLAQTWFEELDDADSICFCRATQQGFLRIITQRSIIGAAATTNAKAWQIYQVIRLDPRVGWMEEPAGLNSAWAGYAKRSSSSPKIWMDAFLAAMAKLHDARLISFDRGFRAFEGLDWGEPSA